MEGDQEVPAYLFIDSIYLSTSYSTQGSSSAYIPDAWIYVDDNLIGAFQLPSRFPVLKKGVYVVKIKPGIKKNGIASTRTDYPFFNPVELDLNLQEGITDSLGVLKTTYTDASIFFLPYEDFEGLAMVLDTTPRSDVPIELTEDGSPLTFEGRHSGLVRLDSTNVFFECVNNKDFDIPFAPVYLEMNFNTNNEFTVGLYLYGPTIIYEHPVLIMNETNGIWKKIYIDLTNGLNAYTNVQKFRIFIVAYNLTGTNEAQILFDNIKLITRNSK
jgi:hypothetical protein